jgi:hypothetical protein
MKRNSDMYTTNDSLVSKSDSETEEDPDLPHNPVWKDALYLRIDPSEEEFTQDVNTAVSLSEHNVEELRLFINPWISVEKDLCMKSTIITSFESILSNFPTISRLFIHVGFYHGNGLIGFQQASAETSLGRGRLTAISSNILPLLAKHKISLKTLCIGGYECLDGGWGTYQGSEVIPSEVFNPEFPAHAFKQLESLDIGISLPISQRSSSEELHAKITTQAHALARFIEQLPALRDLSIRWDQPYHQCIEKTPLLIQRVFPSRFLASLGQKCELQRLRLRGFMAVSRALIHSFLCKNVELEHIEIGRWTVVSGTWRSRLHHIRYSPATSKSATGGVTYLRDRSDPHYEVTKWKPTGCVTTLKVGTDLADAEMELNEDIAPPTERSEGIDRVLSLLTDRNLVMFVDVAEELEKARTGRAAKSKLKQRESANEVGRPRRNRSYSGQ